MLGEGLQKLGLECCAGVYQLAGKTGAEWDKGSEGNNDNAFPEDMNS